MWAQLMRRTLLSLILRVLFLNPVVMGTCSGDSHKLLEQLRHLANLMQDPGMLLDPYIRIQGLDMPGLKEHCRERPGAFPSERDLQGLGRRAFLRTLNAQLGHVLHRLAAFQQDLGMAKMYIHGIRNNVHCLAQLLPGPSEPEPAEPTQAGPGTSPLPTRPPDAFQRKREGCRFLHGFHRFMHSVGQVFRRWREAPSLRSRRHSPRRALQEGAPRKQPSTRGKRLVPRGQLPR